MKLLSKELAAAFAAGFLHAAQFKFRGFRT